jgi:hypothetical protein
MSGVSSERENEKQEPKAAEDVSGIHPAFSKTWRSASAIARGLKLDRKSLGCERIRQRAKKSPPFEGGDFR